MARAAGVDGLRGIFKDGRIFLDEKRERQQGRGKDLSKGLVAVALPLLPLLPLLPSPCPPFLLLYHCGTNPCKIL